jgi:hypothetical protein
MWAWVALTVGAGLIRFDYTIAGYSLATGVALAAGSLLGSRAGARTQGIAAVFLVPLALFGWAGGVPDIGYIAGRIGTAWLAGRLAPAGADPRLPRGARLTLGAMAIVAGVVLWHWSDPTRGMNLKFYYSAVVALALLIAFYYTLRLVRRRQRVLSLLAALGAVYATGLGFVGVLVAAGAVTLPVDPGSLLFHGFVAHLPGDALTAVVVAAFTDPKRRWSHVLEHGESS